MGFDMMNHKQKYFKEIHSCSCYLLPACFLPGYSPTSKMEAICSSETLTDVKTGYTALYPRKWNSSPTGLIGLHPRMEPSTLHTSLILGWWRLLNTM
jgi:hypothetical protein